MRRSFEKIRIPAGLGKDPRFVARAVLGLLLIANLIAAYLVFRPFGGSAEQLDAQVTALQGQVRQRQAALERLRKLVAKIQQARTGGDEFVTGYFMDRRTASSSIVGELYNSAKEAGIRPKEHSYVFDPVEGSDTLSMMTVSANYEGTYGDLLEFVNRLDKSGRFLILDTLTATPIQNTNTLNVNIKMNTFVRENAPDAAL